MLAGGATTAYRFTVDAPTTLTATARSLEIDTYLTRWVDAVALADSAGLTAPASPARGRRGAAPAAGRCSPPRAAPPRSAAPPRPGRSAGGGEGTRSPRSLARRRRSSSLAHAA